MKKITFTAEDSNAVQQITLPETFSVGFSRIDVTPKEYPFPTFDNRYAETIHSHVYTTCIAVCDGEELAFFLTSDFRAAYTPMVDRVKEITRQIAGVSEDHIFYCTTHNHSGPDIGKIHRIDTAIRWVEEYYAQIPGLIKDALLDLSPATITVGKTETDHLNFTRRYWLEDGTFWAIHCGNASKAPKVAYETIADPEMRVIRFHRDGKKDIVLANWQAHAASDASLRPTILTADFIHEFRKGAEEQFGVHFAYFNGACGDVVTGSRIEGDQPYKDTDELGQMLVPVLGKTLENMQPANAGQIRFAKGVVQAPLKTFTQERLEQAMEVVCCEDPEQKKALWKKYGFQSKWEANALRNISIRRKDHGETFPIRHVAISFGDIGFVQAPYEMFHVNGKQVRDASPFPMTFICTNTDGGVGYIPTAEACPRGGYEVYSSSYIPGTGETCALKMAELLQKTKQK